MMDIIKNLRDLGSTVEIDRYIFVNVGLALLSTYILYRQIFPSKTVPDSHKRAKKTSEATEEPLVYQKFTPKSLSPFNGVDNDKVLLAVKGTVYDVTAGRSFYGPGGPYSNFAGRDASRGLAKGSFDDDMLTPIDQSIDELKDLTEEELGSLNEWASHFAGKYIACGELVNE
ncbi:cytochrome b5-like heme/steroid binding domain-containing protein [Dipodascopsis uninucleata]